MNIIIFFSRCWAGMFPREFEGIQQISLNNNWDLNFGEDEDLVSEVALKRAGIYIMIATISIDGPPR